MSEKKGNGSSRKKAVRAEATSLPEKTQQQQIMSTISLTAGDNLTILTRTGGAEFIHVPSVASKAPYKHNILGGITAVPEQYGVTAADSCEVDDSSFVTDGNGTIFKQLIGPRPRNIVRR